MTTYQERMRHINQLLQYIAHAERDSYKPLFGIYQDKQKPTFGYFVEQKKRTIRYYDPHTNRFITMHPNSRALYEKCGESGTGQRLLAQFYAFIKHGKQGHLYDYADTVQWTIEDTHTIRQYAYKIGFISTPHYPQHRF